eukprot:10210297-Heterocapsa_arctica.AAC.1
MSLIAPDISSGEGAPSSSPAMAGPSLPCSSLPCFRVLTPLRGSTGRDAAEVPIAWPPPRPPVSSPLLSRAPLVRGRPPSFSDYGLPPPHLPRRTACGVPRARR